MSRNSSSSSTSSSLTAAIVAASTASLITAAVCYSWHKRETEQSSKNWDLKRQEERTGRIRAEVKLRNVLKEHVSSSAPSTDDPHAMKLSTIGIIVSPYTKRMGTPRQGALVPSSRGFIQFANSLSPQAVEGIDEYSHIWVIFAFHKNTSLATSKKTKIRPPRGGKYFNMYQAGNFKRTVLISSSNHPLKRRH